MLIARKARLAAVGVLAAIILTGCTSAPDAAPESSSAEPTMETQVQPEDRQVETVEFIDPVTVVVTPTESDDPLFGEEFTLHIVDLQTPSEGECGYDTARSYAEEASSGKWTVRYETEPEGVWIDADGEHYGYLGSASVPYAMRMIGEGMALPSAAYATTYESSKVAAQERAAGLWSECPDFGA